MPDDSKDTFSDEQLIEAVLRGNLSSFGTIVQRYWNMAIALALSKINDAIEAEDIAQDSFIKAYSQLHRLRAPCFAGWLSKIVLQQCVNHTRRAGRDKTVTSCQTTGFEALDSRLAFNGNPGLSDSQARFVRRTVSQLPDRFKKLIIMRFVAGLSTPEIAKQLGKRQGTVRVWLYRAYRILRKELAPLLEEVEQL